MVYRGLLSNAKANCIESDSGIEKGNNEHDRHRRLRRHHAWKFIIREN